MIIADTHNILFRVPLIAALTLQSLNSIVKADLANVILV